LNFAIALDRESQTPLRQQIYAEWRKGILAGRFRPGDRVPSTRELALALGVSRGTVSEAWEQLIAEGYFETVQGSGTFVSQEIPETLGVTPRVRPLKPATLKPGTESRSETRINVKLSRHGAGLNRDFHRPRPAPGVIAFLPGIPDCDHFPFALWRRLLARHLRAATPAVFDYAEGSAGHQPLREEIAAYVARTRAVKCTPDQVIVVNGSQQALALCAQLLIEPGDRVAFEDPGYQGARRIFEAHGARLLPCPIDKEGIVLDCLEEKARLAYVTPSHQYPTGFSMSLMRRFELLRWARDAGAAVIEDDYSSEYRYSGPPLPSLQGLANGVPVLYVGTFSKVMFPGLRIGYLIVPRELAARFERAKWLADRHTPVLEQCALADFIGEGHLDRHIRRMRRLYGQRREVLIESLRRHFGNRVRIMGAEAGMHSMVCFDDGRVELRSRLNGVHLVSAAGYYLAHPPAKEFLMGFSAIGERAIREGVKRLAL
jgi:GntR family transcriptional regulator/MocR family aminotransferase